MAKKEESEKKEKQACIFCSIVEGKEKSNVVYENDSLVVIMDAFPVTEGHLLVVPKKHVKDVLDLDVDETSKTFNLARKAGKILVKVLEADSDSGVSRIGHHAIYDQRRIIGVQGQLQFQIVPDHFLV